MVGITTPIYLFILSLCSLIRGACEFNEREKHGLNRERQEKTCSLRSEPAKGSTNSFQRHLIVNTKQGKIIDYADIFSESRVKGKKWLTELAQDESFPPAEGIW